MKRCIPPWSLPGKLAHHCHGCASTTPLVGIALLNRLTAMLDQPSGSDIRYATTNPRGAVAGRRRDKSQWIGRTTAIHALQANPFYSTCRVWASNSLKKISRAPGSPSMLSTGEVSSSVWTVIVPVQPKQSKQLCSQATLFTVSCGASAQQRVSGAGSEDTQTNGSGLPSHHVNVLH